MNLHDIRYCAEECQRQHSGEMSVYHMCNALQSIRSMHHHRHTFITVGEVIRVLHSHIEPELEHSYRRVPVMIGNKLISWENIIIQMLHLTKEIASGPVGVWTPGEWATSIYKEFEEIHPFIDGNGRVGSIIFNWLNDTLDKPIAPPDVFERNANV